MKAIVCDAYEGIRFPHPSAANLHEPVTKWSFADSGGPAVMGAVRATGIVRATGHLSPACPPGCLYTQAGAEPKAVSLKGELSP